MKNLSLMTEDELQTAHANAVKTRMCAGGHNKAQMNGALALDYRDKLLERFGVAPDGREGVFNGEGSY